MELQLSAFSRDQSSKIYVQDLVREHTHTLWKFLSEQDAVVYVAGSANKMPAQVAKAFAHVISTSLGADLATGEKYQRLLETKKRYFVEAW